MIFICTQCNATADLDRAPENNCTCGGVWFESKPLTSSRLRVANGVFYRQRRGVWVPIPKEWVGRVTHPQTIRKRPSKRGQGRHFRCKAMR